MPLHQSILGFVGMGVLAVSVLHALLTLIATLYWRTARRSPDLTLPLPAITVLKPLCGAESGLYENLRSFFSLHHETYQIVFGVRDETDPALPIVRRLIKEFPKVDVAVVVSNRLHGSNLKVSNLINMIAHASYDIIVMSDSDARVGPGYLRAVTEPLRSERVGLVTCIYRDMPTDSVWSRLGAMYINDWYIPSVLLAWMFGHRGFVSGQTICLKKPTLLEIGGLAAQADHLADDYMLGQLVRKSGKCVVLSDYLPHIVRHEPTFCALVEHEVRWMRTIMVLKPLAFRMLFLSFSLPVAILGAVLAAPSHAALALSLLAGALVLRLSQHIVSPRAEMAPAVSNAWLIPARDLLLCYSWYKSLATSRVSWRGTKYRVGADGIMSASDAA